MLDQSITHSRDVRPGRVAGWPGARIGGRRGRGPARATPHAHTAAEDEAGDRDTERKGRIRVNGRKIMMHMGDLSVYMIIRYQIIP